MPFAAALPALITGGSSILGSIFGNNAASSAANQISGAANNSANLQYSLGQQALDLQNQQFQQGQANLAPWLNTGESGLANLANLLGILPQNGSIPSVGTGGNGPTQGGGIGANGSIPQPLAKNPQYGPEKMQMGGKWYEWDSTLSKQNGYDVYRPYSANPQLAKDQSNWIAVKDGQKTPYNMTPGAHSGAGGSTAQTPNGGASLQSLVNPALGPAGSLLQPFSEKFQAPNNLTEQNDPGFQARLQMGTDALQKSAAAKGGLLTGGTARDLNSFAQDYASNEYGNVYNRAFNEYATRYNQFKNNQTDVYNRLASMAGMGQTTAAHMGYMGQNYANSASNILGNIGNNVSNDWMTGANAQAQASALRGSGYGNMAGGFGSILGSLFNKSGSSSGGLINPNAPGEYNPVTGGYN